MTHCIKTGCHVFIEPRNMWALGDAFRTNDVTWFRFCDTSISPTRDSRHFTVHDFAAWYDEGKTSMRQNSTMICKPDHVTDHGYDGVPI